MHVTLAISVNTLEMMKIDAQLLLDCEDTYSSVFQVNGISRQRSPLWTLSRVCLNLRAYARDTELHFADRFTNL